jgi:hypothetical protein
MEATSGFNRGPPGEAWEDEGGRGTWATIVGRVVASFTGERESVREVGDNLP